MGLKRGNGFTPLYSYAARTSKQKWRSFLFVLSLCLLQAIDKVEFHAIKVNLPVAYTINTLYIISATIPASEPHHFFFALCQDSCRSFFILMQDIHRIIQCHKLFHPLIVVILPIPIFCGCPLIVQCRHV